MSVKYLPIVCNKESPRRFHPLGLLNLAKGSHYVKHQMFTYDAFHLFHRRITFKCTVSMREYAQTAIFVNKIPKYTGDLTREVVMYERRSIENMALDQVFTSPSLIFIARKISPKLPPPILRITLYLSPIITCFLPNNMRSKVAIFFCLHHSLSQKLQIGHRIQRN